jgi:outer membrane protein
MALALLVAALAGGCVTRPSREHPPVQQALAEPPERNELPRPRLPSPPEASQALEKLSLQDCRRLALEQSERLESAGEDVLQTQILARKALASAMPKLGVTGKLAQLEEAPSFGGAVMFPEKTDEYYLYLQIPIFSGFKEFQALRQAKSLEAGQKAQIKHLRDGILLNVTDAFYRTLQAQTEVQVRRTALQVQEERLRDAESREKAGVLRRTEVLLIRSQVARDRSNLVRAEQGLEVVRDVLGFLIGFRPPAVLVEAEVQPVGANDVEALIQEAQTSRQDIRALERQVEVARQGVKLALGDYYPKVRMEGELYGDRDGTSKDTDWEARLFAELPIFDGGLRKANLREAFSRVRQAELARDALRRNVEQQVRQAVAELRSSDSLLKALQEQLQASQESYLRTKAEFDRGVATNLEVITAQNLALLSQVDLERERFEQRIKETRLKQAIGRPLLPQEAQAEAARPTPPEKTGD